MIDNIEYRDKIILDNELYDFYDIDSLIYLFAIIKIF